MQGPQSRKFNCEKHSDQKIMFLCAVNDWHFEPLCQLCTPAHTQNHAKRLKINLQSFEQMNKKVLERQKKVSESYQSQIIKLSQILQKVNYLDLPLIKDLKAIEEKIITKVKAYFNDINKKVTQKIKSLLSQNSQKLNSLSQNLQNEIKCIRQITLPQINLQKWKNSAKKIYFEEKLQSYLEESKQIIQEFEQKNQQISVSKKKELIADQNKLFTSFFTQLNAQIKLLVGDFIGQNNKGAVQANNTLKKNIQFQKDQSKKPIPKPKKKTCKNCNEEMQYLTQNKKHLICRFCNFKERNYIKKPI